MKIPAFCLAAVLAFAACAAAEPAFKDPFTAGTAAPERRAMRGDWIIADGIARCTQDDELYKKNKDHGPILFYEVPATDATYRFAVKPSGCQSVVFTLNGAEGHVFRFVTGAKGTGFRAFPADHEKSVQTGVRPDWKFPEGEWTAVVVDVKGTKATVTFGANEPVTLEHAGYTTAKVNFSIGFAFGTLEVKGVEASK
jgi:hypothetical protein